jgi:Listeria/Bacterioides repeat
MQIILTLLLSIVTVVAVKYGSTISKPADPTRAGYTFRGWYKEAACINVWNFAEDSDSPHGSPIAIKAEAETPYWTDDSYKYKYPNTSTFTGFVTMYGEEIKSGTIELAAFVGDECRGSIFLKEIPDYDLEHPYLAFLQVFGEDGDTIKFRLYDHGSNTEYTLNNIDFFVTNAIKGNTTAPYEFFKSSADVVTDNITLYAKWTINTYTVTFNSDGGSAISPITNVEHGSIISKPADPTKAGYTFVSWYKESTYENEWNFATDVVTNNITLYAKWAINTYTVTFDSDGGSAISPITNVEHGTAISKPADPTKTGYTFVSWYKESTYENERNFATDVVTESIILYAKWTINTYTVTFDSDGGSAVSPITGIEHGNTISKPADPTKAGYRFVNWYKEAACTNAWDFATDVVTHNITLYAKWTINTYTVTFDSDGGSAVSPITNIEYGSTISKPADPTKAGYRFVNWYKEAACTNAWDFATDVVTDNITLYAKWEDETDIDNVNLYNIKAYSTPLGIKVENVPAGTNIEVYTIGGTFVTNYTETLINISFPGVYILRVGDVTKAIKN